MHTQMQKKYVAYATHLRRGISQSEILSYYIHFLLTEFYFNANI